MLTQRYKTNDGKNNSNERKRGIEKKIVRLYDAMRRRSHNKGPFRTWEGPQPYYSWSFGGDTISSNLSAREGTTSLRAASGANKTAKGHPVIGRRKFTSTTTPCLPPSFFFGSIKWTQHRQQTCETVKKIVPLAGNPSLPSVFRTARVPVTWKR